MEPTFPSILSDPAAWFAQLGWVDTGALVLLALFAIVGTFKGAVWQLGRLAALGAGVAAAVYGGPRAAQWMFGPEPAPGTVFLAGATAFLAAAVTVSVLAAVAHRAVRQSPLSPVDRLGGAAVGAATGSALVAVGMWAALAFGGAVGVAGQVEGTQALRLTRGVAAIAGDLVPEGVRTTLGVATHDEPAIEPDAPAPVAEPQVVATPALDRLIEAWPQRPR